MIKKVLFQNFCTFAKPENTKNKKTSLKVQTNYLGLLDCNKTELLNQVALRSALQVYVSTHAEIYYKKTISFSYFYLHLRPI